MTSKNIIIVGAVAIGIYLLSQAKKIPFIAEAQKTVRRSSPATTPTIRQRTAQKIAQKIAQKVARKAAPKRIGHPTTQAARIAAQRIAAQRKAAQRKAAQRIAAQRKAAQRIAAARKAAVRKAAARQIGKKIGKTVAQKIWQLRKTRRAVVAQHAKTQRPQIQRPKPSKKQIASRLFPGVERSRIIPYSESSRHSYYGPKSHKLRNEGYGRNKAERDRKRALEFRLNELRTMFPRSKL